MLTIPHMGTNRYALSVIAPDGTDWVQTTTLEGNHDWDSWVMEGNTGYDTEFVVAGEPVPTAVFGFVKPTALPSGAAAGEIKGVVDATKIYVPTVGGLTTPARSSAASTAARSTSRSTARGSPSATSATATRPCTSAAATPTAPSTSRTSPTATTRSRGGTTPRTTSSTSRT